jgi:hypothetical protein
VEINENTYFITQEDGYFQFVKIGAGNYNISVTHPEYNTRQMSIAINESDVVSDIQLVMTKYLLLGKVVDARTKQGVAGVTVSTSEGRQQTTGVEGNYTLDNLKKGPLSLAFSKAGYKGKEQVEVTIPAAGGEELITELEPLLTTLTGTVTNSRNGLPVQDASVSNGEGATVTTDENGVYTFVDLGKTSYNITATKQGYFEYSGTATVAIDQGINTHNFSMTPSTTFLSGKVTDASGATLSGVAITLNPGGATATTGADGTYQFGNLSQSSYTLSASKSGYKNVSTSININLSIENNTFDFTLEQQATSLTGTVTDAGTGAALSGVLVTLGNLNATTSSNGAYRFDNLTQTSYTLSASKSGYQDISKAVTLNLSVQTNTENIQMTPVQQTTSLAGTVTDANTGAALSGVLVRLGSWSYTTSSGGTYRFDNLTQTSYTLSASKSGYQDISKAVSLNLSVQTNTENIRMTPVSNDNPAASVSAEYLALANSIYFTLSFGSATTRYKNALYLTSTVSSLSNDALKALVIANGSYESISDNEFYFYNLNENTSYTYCAVGFDSQSRTGNLLRVQSTTKSSSNQPRATINISSVGGGRINLSISKNSYCNFYSFIYLSSNSSAISDTECAAIAHMYRNENRETSNLSGYIEKNMSYYYTYIVTLAYDNYSNNSGIVDVKVVNNDTGAIIRSTQLNTVRSTPQNAVEKTVIKREPFVREVFHKNK